MATGSVSPSPVVCVDETRDGFGMLPIRPAPSDVGAYGAGGGKKSGGQALALIWREALGPTPAAPMEGQRRRKVWERDSRVPAENNPYLSL